MSKLRSTHDGRLIYKTSYAKGARLFSGTVRLQNRKIARDTVRKFVYDIPKKNISTSQVTVVSRLCDKLKIIL